MNALRPSPSGVIIYGLRRPSEMQEFFVSDLVMLAREIGRLGNHYSDSEGALDAEIQESNKQLFLRDAESLDRLGLQMCKFQVKRIADSMGKPMPEISKMFDSLYERLVDECLLRRFVALSVKDAEYIFPANPLFGADVEDKYPSAAFEIEEAGKCLGLSRATASVFHLMRVMEVGIGAISKCLGIPDPVRSADRNWGAILRTIKAELDRRNGALPAIWANPEKEFFENAYVSLDAVRNPWRNATMHVENKYTEDEAEHIFVAVKGFMKKLASRMDENGEPKA